MNWGYTMATANNLNMPIGIIDIGSNSVRLLITDGVFFKKRLITTRLGEGASETKILCSDAIKRTLNAVSELKKQALNEGVKNVFAFATQAVRGAKNKTDFLNGAFTQSGLKVEVLSGDDEAEIGLLGANFGSDGGVVDVGGASTEIAVIKGGSVVYKKSVEVGAVSLRDKFSQNKTKIKEYCSLKVKEFTNLPNSTFKAIGGTATALATIDLKLKEYDASKTDGHYLSRQNLMNIEDVLYSISKQEILRRYAVTLTRAEIIAGGCTLLLEALKVLNLDGITVSESDNLEGYFYRLRGLYEN